VNYRPVQKFTAISYVVLTLGVSLFAFYSPTPWLFFGGALLFASKSMRSIALASRREPGAADDYRAGRTAAGTVLVLASLVFTASWVLGEGGLGLAGAAFAGLLAALFLLAGPRREPTRDEVADLIERFVAGNVGEWEWDGFISVRSADPAIEHVRQQCDEIHDAFPDRWDPHRYCSDAGRQELLRLAARLRGQPTDP
jgi:hypothetical protein